MIGPKPNSSIFFRDIKSDSASKNLVFSPIVDPKEAFFRNLKEYSHLADFTFLGLKMPSREEQGYEEYISSMLQETKELSNLAFVLAGEDLNFEKIFNPSV